MALINIAIEHPAVVLATIGVLMAVWVRSAVRVSMSASSVRRPAASKYQKSMWMEK
jgi:hypothetical protein